jgi:hypothetical protein
MSNGDDLPLVNGRAWEQVGVETVRTNRSFAVVDQNDPTTRGFFKYVNAANPAWSSLYSLAMERVAHTLGQALAIPIPETYLETVDGHVGVITLKVPGTVWEHVSDDTLRRATFADAAMWPTYAAFDVFLGNTDRHSENIHVEWNPPLRRIPGDDEQCALWMLDYGAAGLWPVHKFDEAWDHSRLEQVPADADIADVHALRNNMPVAFRRRLVHRGSEEREQVLANFQGITEDRIEAAVNEIPRQYMTAAAAELTKQFLSGRLTRLGTLLDTVFPV